MLLTESEQSHTHSTIKDRLTKWKISSGIFAGLEMVPKACIAAFCRAL